MLNKNIKEKVEEKANLPEKIPQQIIDIVQTNDINYPLYPEAKRTQIKTQVFDIYNQAFYKIKEILKETAHKD